VYGHPPQLPRPALPYASAGAVGRVGESGFGVASVVTCLVMVLCTMVWSFGLTRITGLGLLPWVFAGIPLIWIGSGFGFVMGMIGMLQQTRGQRWAKHGMWLSVLIGLVPVIVLQITTATAK
jgi:hypothetical protein